MLISGLTGYAVGLLTLTQAAGLPLMLFGLTFTAGGGALYLTTASSLVSKQAGESERGLVLGAYNSMSWFGRTLGPPVTGTLFDVFGSNAPLFTAALIFVPCIVILLAVVARVEREQVGRV